MWYDHIWKVIKEERQIIKDLWAISACNTLKRGSQTRRLLFSCAQVLVLFSYNVPVCGNSSGGWKSCMCVLPSYLKWESESCPSCCRAYQHFLTLRLRCSFLTLANASLSRSLSHSNKSSWLIPPQAQGVLLFKAQSVFSPFHPSEEAELTSADPHSQSPSQLQPASHSFSQSLIHCSFFWVLKSKTLHLNSALAHSPTLSFHDLSWEEVKRVHFHSHLDILHLCCSGLWIKKKKTDCLVILNIYCITETSATQFLLVWNFLLLQLCKPFRMYIRHA